MSYNTVVNFTENTISVLRKNGLLNREQKFSSLFSLLIEDKINKISVYGESSKAYLEDCEVNSLLELFVKEILPKHNFKISDLYIEDFNYNMYKIEKNEEIFFLFSPITFKEIKTVISDYIKKDYKQNTFLAILCGCNHYYFAVKEKNEKKFERFSFIDETNSYKWTCGINTILNLSEFLGINIKNIGIEKTSLEYVCNNLKNTKSDFEEAFGLTCCLLM